jgi:glycosyltransferase involved in cell wall biosynthesis
VRGPAGRPAPPRSALARPHLAHLPPPPDDPSWAHVTINELSRHELAAHGIAAITLYNTFDPSPPRADRDTARHALGLPAFTRLLLQPTRALARKNIAGGLALAEAVGGTYWLLGPAEDGYGPELERLIAAARCPVLLGTGARPMTVAEAYAACDAVLLPSHWEGFGNPSVESATHLRPLAIGHYPVAAELAAFGFTWFDSDQPAALDRWLDHSDEIDGPDGLDGLLAHNHGVAATYFNLADLPGRLAPVIEGLATRFG